MYWLNSVYLTTDASNAIFRSALSAVHPQLFSAPIPSFLPFVCLQYQTLRRENSNTRRLKITVGTDLNAATVKRFPFRAQSQCARRYSSVVNNSVVLAGALFLYEGVCFSNLEIVRLYYAWHKWVIKRLAHLQLSVCCCCLCMYSKLTAYSGMGSLRGKRVMRARKGGDRGFLSITHLFTYLIIRSIADCHPKMETCVTIVTHFSKTLRNTFSTHLARAYETTERSWRTTFFLFLFLFWRDHKQQTKPNFVYHCIRTIMT